MEEATGWGSSPVESGGGSIASGDPGRSGGPALARGIWTMYYVACVINACSGSWWGAYSGASAVSNVPATFATYFFFFFFFLKDSCSQPWNNLILSLTRSCTMFTVALRSYGYTMSYT